MQNDTNAVRHPLFNERYHLITVFPPHRDSMQMIPGNVEGCFVNGADALRLWVRVPPLRLLWLLQIMFDLIKYQPPAKASLGVFITR